ncbi:MAG: DUF1565 domain-containing protein [Christensenellales bacterium]
MKVKRMICLLLGLVFALCALSGCSETPASTAPEVSAEVAAIYAAAEERKNAILNSPTSIVKADEYIMGETYSGTAYYVSNNGSDYNDGLSPDTPFATVDVFNDIELQYGDAIFFERGSMWRTVELPWSIRGTEGLTISAYGEGAKPAFYGSEENGTGSEKWELFYSDASGRKIWKFYKEMTEVASIVLNGKEFVLRDVAYWNGKSYLQMEDDHQFSTNKIYDVISYLPDMWCFPAIVYPDMSTEKIGDRLFRSWNEQTGEDIFYKGPLYFRCDAGNPGKIYSDIEFIMPYAFSDGMSDYQTFDNICIRYSSMTFCSGFNRVREACNGVVQNCEVGWMGGNVFSYATGDETGDTRIQLNAGLYGRNGGAMSFAGSNYTIRNNYVHDSFQEGIALETFDDCDTMEGCIVSGNLIERATQGILVCNWDLIVNPNHIFKNILIEDNMVLDSGVNNFFSTDWETDYCNAMVIQGGPCANENLLIRNNTFAFATGALVIFDDHSQEYSRIFSGNTYVQTKWGKGIRLENRDTGSSLTEKYIRAYLGDESATIISPN